MAELPKDPVMLLSFINTQLRDQYATLNDLCRTYMVEENDILQKLSSIDYEYDKRTNQFV